MNLDEITTLFIVQIKDGLRIPFEATLGFADVIIFCAVILVAVNRIRKGKKKQTSKTEIPDDV